MTISSSRQDLKRDLYLFDAKWRETGCRNLAGVDEVGRGCLAGPVVAAAVMLPSKKNLPHVRDSKTLTHSKRKSLEAVIKKEAVSYAIQLVPPEEIDSINILNASLKAMAMAVKALSPAPDFILVDGNAKIACHTLQKAVIGGDRLSLSIAAASILAKVFRDELMDDYHKKYPAYNLKKNKGYATIEHRNALKKFGPASIHRMTFKGVLPPKRPSNSLNLQ